MGHRVSPIHHSESSLTRWRSEEREDQALRRGQKIEVRERERIDRSESDGDAESESDTFFKKYVKLST